MHQSVLLQPAIDALAIKPDGIYIDGTFGRGGHSQAILSQLGAQGRLIAIDKDPQAVEAAAQIQDVRFTLVHDSFANIESIAKAHGIAGQVDGLLLDLGVSSPQLDQAERGFSFMKDGPLGMRMDTTQGESVVQWLAHAEEKNIADVLWRYGEEKFSRRIARKITETRAEHPIVTTLELAELISSVVPKREPHKHPATRSFQALRIMINRELEDLESCLAQLPQVLAAQGHAVIISFHSLEDRIVKNRFRDWVQGPQLPRHLPIQNDIQPKWRWVVKKQVPDKMEIESNARARSAVMRAVEKI